MKPKKNYTLNWLSHKIYLVHWLDRIQKRINTFSALSNESCTHYSVWLSMRISAPNYSSLAFLSIAIERVPSEGCRWLTFNLTHMIYTWYVILFLVNFAGLHSFAQPMSNWCCYLTAWLARVSNWHLPRTLFSHLISLIGWSKHRCCTFFTNHETVWCWFYRFALVPFYWKIILYFVYICFFFFFSLIAVAPSATAAIERIRFAKRLKWLNLWDTQINITVIKNYRIRKNVVHDIVNITFQHHSVVNKRKNCVFSHLFYSSTESKLTSTEFSWLFLFKYYFCFFSFAYKHFSSECTLDFLFGFMSNKPFNSEMNLFRWIPFCSWSARWNSHSWFLVYVFGKRNFGGCLRDWWSADWFVAQLG